MRKRIGTVLRFKEGVTREQVAEALYNMLDILDLENTSELPCIQEGENLRGLVAPAPIEMFDCYIYEYRDDYLKPTWYCVVRELDKE